MCHVCNPVLNVHAASARSEFQGFMEELKGSESFLRGTLERFRKGQEEGPGRSEGGGGSEELSNFRERLEDLGSGEDHSSEESTESEQVLQRNLVEGIRALQEELDR